MSHSQMYLRKWNSVLDLNLTESAFCLGAPIIMSSPHFYQADEKFVQDVFGMRPDKEQHQTVIDINPVGISTLIPNIQISKCTWCDNCQFLYHNILWNLNTAATPVSLSDDVLLISI